MTRKRNGRGRSHAQLLATLATQRAFSDAIYSHLVDLAYERMKDPEWRKFLDELFEKYFPEPSSNGKKIGFANHNKKPK